jgi:hypothetical protein
MEEGTGDKVFHDVMSYSLAEKYKSSGGTYPEDGCYRYFSKTGTYLKCHIPQDCKINLCSAYFILEVKDHHLLNA